MYTPGTAPVTFELDGYRFGLALGLDVLFPELFTEYDGLGADVVLVSYSSNGVDRNEHIGVQVRGAAANNTSWISIAAPANPDSGLASGVSDPRGQWLAQCPAGGTSSVVVAALRAEDLITIGRDFRRRTRERISS
jgi:predicted amidohydrolase